MLACDEGASFCLGVLCDTGSCCSIVENSWTFIKGARHDLHYLHNTTIDLLTNRHIMEHINDRETERELGNGNLCVGMQREGVRVVNP